MADDDDGVPPLEDMTEYLQMKKKQVPKSDSSLLGLEWSDHSGPSLSLQKELMIVNNDKPDEIAKGSDKGVNGSVKSAKGSGEGAKRFDEGVKRSGEGVKWSGVVVKGSGSFGGMRKGFLFGSSSAKTKSSNSQNKEKIPFVKSKPETSKSLEIEEVQEEMKRVHPLLANKDWITEELLKKIEQNPILSKVFSDPSLSKVLEEFHNNPQETMKAAQSNNEIRQFLQEFCSIMGDHFMSLKEPPNDEQHISEHLTEEDQRMKEALTKPEVQNILKDPSIQKLMNYLLKDGIQEAQKYLDSNRSEEFQSKVRLLIEHGVLNVQRL